MCIRDRFIVLAVSAFLGDSILNFFGVTIPSFQVGGGILLMLIAISMMHGKQSGCLLYTSFIHLTLPIPHDVIHHVMHLSVIHWRHVLSLIHI